MVKRYFIAYKERRDKSDKWTFISFSKKPNRNLIKRQGFGFILENKYQFKILRKEIGLS